ADRGAPAAQRRGRGRADALAGTPATDRRRPGPAARPARGPARGGGRPLLCGGRLAALPRPPASDRPLGGGGGGAGARGGTLHGDAGAGAQRLAREVDVDRVLGRRVERVVIGDVRFREDEPAVRSPATAGDRGLLDDVGAHGITPPGSGGQG